MELILVPQNAFIIACTAKVIADLEGVNAYHRHQTRTALAAYEAVRADPVGEHDVSRCTASEDLTSMLIAEDRPTFSSLDGRSRKRFRFSFTRTRTSSWLQRKSAAVNCMIAYSGPRLT